MTQEGTDHTVCAFLIYIMNMRFFAKMSKMWGEFSNNRVV